MSNVAIIFAGGVGKRMGTDLPKQFLQYNQKEIIIYTLERFQQCVDIDEISIACHREYLSYCNDLVQKYNISKVKWIVPGGSTGQESIMNALCAAYEDGENDGLAVICDGVRPLVTTQLITSCINVAQFARGAVAAVKAVETVAYNKNGKVEELLDRERLLLIKAPQVFPINDLYQIQKKAMAKGDTNNIDTISLMTKYGYNDYEFVMSDYTNIKITTMQDFEMFKAYMGVNNAKLEK